MKLVILDRDGVINVDSSNYIKSAEEWIPEAGSLEAIAELKKAGFAVAIATNQSGLARGLFDETALQQQHDKMQALLKPLGGAIDFIAYCPHLPDAGCDCRKPMPGLLWQIAEHFDVDLLNVPFVGDTLKDLQAAQVVGAKPFLVLTGKGEATRRGDLAGTNPIICDNLAAAVKEILKDE